MNFMRTRQANLETFAFLGDLQGKLMVLSQEILTLLKGQLAALEKAIATGAEERRQNYRV
jgi:hypothetical protein